MGQPLANAPHDPQGPSAIKAVLFDLDGTLVDTDALHFQIWQDLLTEYALEIDRPFYDRTFSGRLNQELLQEILPQLSESEAIALGEHKEAVFRDRGASSLEPMAGLVSLLDKIDDQGIAKAVVTNAPRQNALFMLQALKVDHRFPTVVIGEEVERAKPHPRPYEVGLERLGHVRPEEAVVFEDSPTGITAAVAAGIFTIGVASTQPPEALLELGAQWVITDFTDPRVITLLRSPSPAA